MERGGPAFDRPFDEVALKIASPSHGWSHRRAPSSGPIHEEAAMTDGVTMYVSEPDATIERLAQLDSARRPTGPVLVAVAGGEPVAALPLDGGPAIADPFQPTAALVSLLELRLAQMRDRPRPQHRARFFVALRRRARASGELAARA
jgi:hypothetical protein